MKTMKKMFAMLLAVVMVMSLGVSALADGSGSITIQNASADHTYTAYKIFDVTYTSDNSGYAYSISTASAWLDVIGAYIGTDSGVQNGGNFMESIEKQGTASGNGLTLTLSANGNEYVITVTDGFSAADFAEYLSENKPDTVTGTTLNFDATAKTASATGLDLGYYFVTSSLGSLANLTTTDPNVVIYDKNEQPVIDKKQKDGSGATATDDPLSVEVGDTVYYEITGKVPSTTGYETYTYVVSDTMSSGLTLNANSFELVIDGLDKTENDGVVKIDVNGNTFTVTFDMIKLNAIGLVGNVWTLNYSAVVNQNAVATVSENNAELEYSNDPNSTSKGKATDEVEVYTSKIVIDKYAYNNADEADTSKKLADASFVLYRLNANNQKEYYKSDSNGVVSWDPEKENATVVTTNASGEASFRGLEDGTYYLEEIEAPDGYNLLTEPIEVKVNAEAKAKEITGDTSDYKEKWEDAAFNEAVLTYDTGVANSTGTELPSTGGIGTTIFYVIGAILVIGAAVLLITKKRMSGTKE